MCIGIDNERDDFSTKHDEECSSAVILELKKRHNCKRLVKNTLVIVMVKVFSSHDMIFFCVQVYFNNVQSTTNGS